MSASPTLGAVTPDQLSRTVCAAVRRAVADGELARVAVPERVTVRRPPRPGDGDWATGVALALAGPAGRPARQVAEVLRARLCGVPGIARVEVAGPGFLNISLDGAARARLVAELVRQGADRPGAGEPSPGETVGGASGEWVVVPPRHDALRDAERWAAATGEAPTGEAPTDGATDGAVDGAVDGASEGAGRTPSGAVPAHLAPLLVQRESNPLFRVQYAYARTRALCRNARDLGFSPDPEGAALEAPEEAELLALLADHDRVSRLGAAGDTTRLARHLVAVADAVLRLHQTWPLLPRGDEKPSAAHRARLALAQAAGTVLAGGLSQLGVTAPAHL